MSGVGGYVRHGERRYVPPAPGDAIPRCGYCRARLDIGMLPHLCKEVTFETPVTLRGLSPVQMAGEFLHNMLNPQPEPGPPYVWLADTDDDGKPVLRLLNPDPVSSSLPDGPEEAR